MYDDGCKEICEVVQAMHKETLFGIYRTQRPRRKNETGTKQSHLLYPHKQPKRVKMTASKHRHIPRLLCALPPTSRPCHTALSHSRAQCVWSQMLDDAVVILSKNAGSNEPQSHADFSHSVGLKRVVESEGGVWTMGRQRRACGWLEWPLLHVWLTGAPFAD